MNLSDLDLPELNFQMASLIIQENNNNKLLLQTIFKSIHKYRNSGPDISGSIGVHTNAFNLDRVKNLTISKD